MPLYLAPSRYAIAFPDIEMKIVIDAEAGIITIERPNQENEVIPLYSAKGPSDFKSVDESWLERKIFVHFFMDGTANNSVTGRPHGI